jgi:hypothetical protein
MKKATYIAVNQRTKKTASRKPFTLTLTVLLALVFTVLGGIAALPQKSNVAYAGNVDNLLCNIFGTDVSQAYQFFATDDFHFAVDSKSSFGGGNEGVDSYWLNNIIDLSGGQFKKNNEAILGRPLYQEGVAEIPSVTAGPSTPPTASTTANTFNTGTKLNPYDRFGLAGLNWTGYLGEWKYLQVNVCASSDPNDPKAGLFYEERLVPQTPYNAQENSSDIRTLQHVRGLAPDAGMAFLNVVANWIFDISKILVGFTLAFINLAFSDVTKLLGVQELLTGGDGGLFQKLFKGIFLPLIVVVFALTGLNIGWHGIVKRQYRTALTVLLRSLAMFLAAIVISLNPSFWVALPNNVSIVMQSVLIGSMNQGMSGGNGMCATTVGATTTQIVQNQTGNYTNVQVQADILTQASANMRSSLGCSFWQQFLLRPWVEGQFGDDWNHLWAAEKIPSWAAPGATSITNQKANQEMVGDAAVPLGDDTFMYNWAIFQISTQTNAHSPINKNGQYGKYTAGLNNDWWRVVDGLSNYQEKTIAISTRTGNETALPADQTNPSNDVAILSVPINSKEAPPDAHWNTWVGNDVAHRLITALAAVFVTIIAILAPLLFAAMAAIFALGTALLMAFAPLMLLMGCWAGKGWEIFKGWSELLINTVIRRIITGVLLVVALIFTSVAIHFMETENWWTGMMLLAILSAALIKGRHKIMEMMAAVRFASTNFAATGGRLKGQTIGATGSAGRLVGTGVVGGLAAGSMTLKSGGGFGAAMSASRSGFASGSRTELRNMAYRNRALRQTMTTFDTTQQQMGKGVLSGRQYCRQCETIIDEFSQVYFDKFGNMYCDACGDDLMNRDPDGDLGLISGTIASWEEQKEKKELEELAEEKPLKSSYAAAKEAKDLRKLSTSPSQDAEKNKKIFLEATALVADDILRHRAASEELGLSEGSRNSTTIQAPLPPELSPYINHEELRLAWENRQYDYIRAVYALAWAKWAQETFAGNVAEILDSTLDGLVEGTISSSVQREEKILNGQVRITGFEIMPQSVPETDNSYVEVQEDSQDRKGD